MALFLAFSRFFTPIWWLILCWNEGPLSGLSTTFRPLGFLSVLPLLCVYWANSDCVGLPGHSAPSPSQEICCPYLDAACLSLTWKLSQSSVLPMGFSPGQVHYGFHVTKEITVECSWGERVIPNFIFTVAGQSLESHPLRASLHAASWSLPLGLSTHAAISVSVLGATTTPASSLLTCSLAAIPPCCTEHGAGLFI